MFHAVQRPKGRFARWLSCSCQRCKRYLPTSEDWSMFAAALGKDERVVQRIELQIRKKVLSTAEKKMLWSDWQAYRKMQNHLWQWYRQAEIINKPDEYLQRIAEVAIAFNQQQPVPLSERAIEAMQKDLLLDNP